MTLQNHSGDNWHAILILELSLTYTPQSNCDIYGHSSTYTFQFFGQTRDHQEVLKQPVLESRLGLVRKEFRVVPRVRFVDPRSRFRLLAFRIIVPCEIADLSLKICGPSSNSSSPASHNPEAIDCSHTSL